MKKIHTLVLLCILFSSTFAFAKDDKSPAAEKFDSAKKDLVATHIDFAKASIENGCEKLKQKIKDYEEELQQLETNVDQIDAADLCKRRAKLLKKIQKSQDRIYNLRLLRSSAEMVDFTDL